MATGSPDILHNLMRRRSRERANATRFSTFLKGYEDSTPLEYFEHYCGRVKETLHRFVSLDNSIHERLLDKEYEEDITSCEEYMDKTKRTIQKPSRRIDDSMDVSTTRLSIDGLTQRSVPASTGSVPRSVKLPAIKLEPFTGNTETWSRFWEQFRSSIDEDASLPTIN